jgi:hypothetical protein
MVKSINPEIEQKYREMGKSYFDFMQESRKMNDAMLFLSTRVAPMLAINSYCSTSELKQIFGDEFFNAVMDLPREAKNEIVLNRGLTKDHLDDLTKQLHERDLERRQMHNQLLQYASTHFEKNSLEVYIDIMRYDPLSILDHRLNIFSPLRKNGVCITQLGFLQTKNLTHEGYREYGEEYPFEPNEEDWATKHKKTLIEQANRSLEKMKADNFNWQRKIYESFIKNGRTYEEDADVAKQIVSKFQDYTTFNGDYWMNTCHGRSYFIKLIEFDLNKIKSLTADPEREIDAIRKYIASFIPEKERSCHN